MDASNTRLRSWEGNEGRTKEYLNSNTNTSNSEGRTKEYLNSNTNSNTFVLLNKNIPWSVKLSPKT